MADSLTLYRFPVDKLAEWNELARTDADGTVDEKAS